MSKFSQQVFTRERLFIQQMARHILTRRLDKKELVKFCLRNKTCQGKLIRSHEHASCQVYLTRFLVENSFTTS